jgi:hypothetical protein
MIQKIYPYPSLDVLSRLSGRFSRLQSKSFTASAF